MKFNLNKENVLKILKLNNVPSENSGSPELIKAKRNIYLQAGLAILTIVLTIVIIFSMTAAWYTNIAETSGLIFEVETWGYTGEVKIAGGPISAAPGDSGVVALSVDGGSEEILDVKVTVTKEEMSDPEMQKRLFFYVDTPATLNDETVERVYVNSISDYTYTLLSRGSVIMSEDFSNVPELKWQWVYDVLGYYVLADETEGFKIVEYLRPIEYDYDKATFAPDTVILTTGEGEKDISAKKIATVDGTLTPEEFLEKFSETDGYDGVLNIKVGDETAAEGESFSVPFVYNNGNYYKIGEDENGRGIYAYLCSYSEIEFATGYDTDLGKAEPKPQFTATVSVTVEQKNVEAVSVSDKKDFVNAIKDGAFIKLESSNIDMGEEFIEIPEGAEVWIDLGGNTITSKAANNDKKGAIYAAEGSSVTLLNGSITGENLKDSRAIESVGAEINISGVDISGFERAVNISDEKSPETDSTVRISNCTFDADSVGVFISGNGPETEQKTRLIIENSEITSKGYGITGNGSENRIGTDIRIINSTIESTGTDWGPAIYHPQRNSTLTVYNSTIRGFNGIIIKGGSVEIINSEICGTANIAVANINASVSGSADTGDAIYIENNYDNSSVSLVIKENESTDSENPLKPTKLESTKNYALRVYNASRGDYKIVIYKGTFVGTFEPEESWFADGSKPVSKTEGIQVTPATLLDETE